MGMKVALDGAVNCGSSVWLARLEPHEIKLLGSPKNTQGRRSILLVNKPFFDARSHRLEMNAAHIMVLNLGTSSDTIVVDADSYTAVGSSPAPSPNVIGRDEVPPSGIGRGDQAFLEVVRSEAPTLLPLAQRLLTRVRERFPGDLRKGKRRNFTETPDNFWGVLVQPRAKNLMITVDGKPERFRGISLELKPMMARYTRFYIQTQSEADEAFNIIERAKNN